MPKLTKRVLIAIVIAMLVASYVWIQLYQALIALPLDSAREISKALIQFVSFLTAGWTAGFFYLYRGFREELQRARNLFEKHHDTLEKGFKRTNTFRQRVKSLADAKGIPFDPYDNFPSTEIKEEAKNTKTMMDSKLEEMNTQLGGSFKVALATFVSLGLAVTLSIIGILSGGGYVFLAVSALVLAILLALYSLSSLKTFMESHSQYLNEVGAALVPLWRSIEAGIDEVESIIELVKAMPSVPSPSTLARLKTRGPPPTP